jgi:hypothetical protein
MVNACPEGRMKRISVSAIPVTMEITVISHSEWTTAQHFPVGLDLPVLMTMLGLSCNK